MRSAVWFLGALVIGCDVPSPTGRAEAPIVGGAADTEHEAVVAIRSPQHPLGTFCSGTLITPTVVLTAAHCIHGAEQNDAEVFVFFGADVESDGVSIPVLAMERNPAWAPSDVTSGDDVGLLRLASPAPVAPMAIGPTPRQGAVVTLVGYGFDTENETGIGVRRRNDAEVGQVRVGDFELIDSLSCDGDSGGAVLASTAEGVFVVGVHSQGTCGESSWEARIDVHRESLIDPFIAAGATCMMEGVCVMECSPPDPDCEPTEGGGGGGAGGNGGGGAASDHDDGASEGGCNAAPHEPSNTAFTASLVALIAAWCRGRARRDRRRACAGRIEPGA